MQHNSQSNTFHKIMQQDKALLEAGIMNQVLKLRLTVSESIDVVNVYVGEIGSFDQHQKLRETFDTFEEILIALKDQKNVKLSLDDLSVTLITQLGKKTIQFAQIMLKKQEKEYFEPISLQEIINRCNSKDEIDNDEIKRNLQILAKQIIELKQQQKKEQCEYVKLKQFEKISLQKSQNIESSFKRKTDNLCEQIIKLKQEIEHIEQQTKGKFISLQNVQYKMKFLDSFVRLEQQKCKELTQKCKNQKWCNQFNFDGHILTKVGDDNGTYQFVFFKDIPFDQQYKFQIKIIKSEYKFIYIGVINYQQQKQKQYSSGSKNALSYYASNGQKFPGGQKQGRGVAVGETVQVRVDRKNSMIRWFVNNLQKASHTHQILGDQKKNLMPYVQMLHVGDTLECTL